MKTEEQVEQRADRKPLKLNINNETYEWQQQYILGTEVRTLGNIAPDELIFLAIKKPWEDELIEDDTRVNLARPEIEHFFSKKTVIIIVNGTPYEWGKHKICFEDVVTLAYGAHDPNPNIVYTVTYDRGPKKNPEGSMVKGDCVRVKDKMIFNVTRTDKS
ncbi:MAG: multiubiquitin domain-containing protein [Flavobacteriales bacterium]